LELKVNPTRMELRKIKGKYKTAQKGHRLLKDKTNELIRKFYATSGDTISLRENVDGKLKNILENFSLAKLKLEDSYIDMLFSLPNEKYDLEFRRDAILSVEVPKIKYEKVIIDSDAPSIGMMVGGRMQVALDEFYKIIPELIKLAETEKSTFLLASEIEKNKRRVNALENILMPTYRKTIGDIELKLAENERSTTASLMKIKDMLSKK